MTVTDETTGGQLAASLLLGVGNEEMRAATRLLGEHRDGYWLRRFLDEEQTLTAATDQKVIDRSGTHPSVDWTAAGLLLVDSPSTLPASESKLAVLKFAVSLAGRGSVTLQSVVRALDEHEFRLALRALQEAAYGEAG
ncbi:hypothetical protein [Streptomyces hyaluromycini]|uniref:hypothetical protein n=1 Tax=Streptomyces hyaluromycini TaxID=1377993 RepID=UPI000B5C69C2|nr:hypothetical protein [Streptomyces hyaluromycini]